VNKKKVIIRTLVKHQNMGSYLNGEWYTVMATCICGWEKECADRSQTDKLHSKHVYSMIKEALKKRKQILNLTK
jgi:hypothetical protein